MADSPCMDQSHDQSSGLLRRGKRIAVVLGAAALFIGAASVIKPDPQGAQAGTNPTIDDPSTTRGGPRQVADHPKGWKLLGTLEGREHILKCWGTNDGPRYSVHAPDGRLIQDDLPADEVYRGFPDIELPNLRVDPPADGGSSGGMLVDFVDVWRD